MTPRLKELLERRKAQTDTAAPTEEVEVEESVEDSPTAIIVVTELDLATFRDEFSEFF